MISPLVCEPADYSRDLPGAGDGAPAIGRCIHLESIAAGATTTNPVMQRNSRRDATGDMTHRLNEFGGR